MTFLVKIGVSIDLLFSSIFGLFNHSQIPISTIATSTLQTSATAPTSSSWIPLSKATSSFYTENNGQVYYKYLYSDLYTPSNTTGNTWSNSPVPPADANTFLASSQSYQLGKDKNHVYFDGAIIGNADPKSFELIPAENGKLYSIPNSNSLPLYQLGKPYYVYAKDDSNVYCDGDKITGADPNTFQPLFTSPDNANITQPGFVQGDLDIAKDKNNIYLGCVSNAKIVPNVPQQFLYDVTLDAAGNAIDTGNALWNPDPTTFVNLDDWYFKDKNNVYQHAEQSASLERIVYADPATFVVLQNNRSEWAKDKRYVYDYGHIVSGIDPKNFTTLSPDTAYATDGKTLFYSTGSEYLGLYQSVAGVDFPTLKVFLNGYAEDKNNVFFEANILEGVDPATINFLGRTDCSKDPYGNNPQCQGTTYLADKNSVFFVNEELPTEDITDVSPIPQLVEKIEGADLATFRLVQGTGFDAQDKNHKYLRGQIVQ